MCTNPICASDQVELIGVFVLFVVQELVKALCWGGHGVGGAPAAIT